MKFIKILVMLLTLGSITAFIAGDDGGLDPKTVKYIHKHTEWRQVDDSLFMWATEVSNLQYREFLDYLKNQGKIEDYYRYHMDTSGNWGVSYYYGEPLFKKIYHFPFYNHYPVINITYEGAVAYCNWLTDLYNNNKHGFKSFFNKVEVRLPSREEWLAAASQPDPVDESGIGKYDKDFNKVYPWGGYSTRDNDGNLRANFMLVRQGIIGGIFRDSALIIDSTTATFNLAQDGYYYQAPVKSFYMNSKGLYNLSGNVAEMLNEPGTTIGGSWGTTAYYMRLDIDVDPYKGWTEPSPFIGFRPVMEVIEE